MRILLGCTYITAGAYSMRWRGGKGTIICSTLHEPRSVWVHGLRFLRHVAHQSCAFWVFNIYMFGPHSKRWWLSSRTHLSGYQRYRCFPSVGPLGPSRLFAWQQERLIWLRRGLLFLLVILYIYRSCFGMTWYSLSTHTCMCTHESLPSSRSG